MKPFFSIIIPTYNRAQLIGKAIDSVVKQTFSDWELVIVDDGSTDDTKDVIEKYKLQNNRIKYIYQPNAERSAARNNGIKNAQGEYICFLDSDDYFLPNRLEILFKELKKRSFQVAAFFTGVKIEKNGSLFPKEDLIHTDNIFEYLVLTAIHSQQVCIHSNILKEVNYDTQLNIGEDLELWMRIANKFPFIRMENQHTIVVVDHEDRTVNVKRNNVYFDTLRLCKHIFNDEKYGNRVSHKTQLKIIGNCYYGVVKYNIYQRRRFLAMYYLTKSILIDTDTPLLKFRVNIFLKLLLGVSIKKIEKFIE